MVWLTKSKFLSVIEQAEAGHGQAELALGVFCYRIKKYIGAYLAALNGADALIFTGGIGENASRVREQACADLNNLGIAIAPDKNRNRSNKMMEIQQDSSPIKVLVIPSQTLRYISSPV